MIAIISATEDELSAFIKSLSDRKSTESNSVKFIEGSMIGINLVVCISGVGIKRARNAANTLLRKYKPEIIVSAGFAGALNPKLRLGDLVLSENSLSLKQTENIKLFTDLPYIAAKFIKGTILTESGFISSRDKKLDLFVKSSADIVDMETWPIAEIAKKDGVRLISIRAVSDITSNELPRMEKIFGRDTKIDLKKSFRYFKENPDEILNFLRFKYFSLRKARISLNSFLTVLVPILSRTDI